MKLATAAKQNIHTKLGDRESIIQSELEDIKLELESSTSLTDDRIDYLTERKFDLLDELKTYNSGGSRRKRRRKKSHKKKSLKKHRKSKRRRRCSKRY